MVAVLLLGVFVGYLEFLPAYNTRDRVGVISFLSSRDIAGGERNIALGIFGEKAFIGDMFSVRADLPFGIMQNGDFLISDLIATLKFNPLDIVLSPSFLISFEFPTGTSPATQDRIFISPKLSLGVDIAVVKLSFLLGGNFSPSRDGAYNVLYPHTANEIFLFVGGGVSIIPKILTGELRLGGFWEEMKYLVFEPQLHLGVSVPTPIADIKGNIFGFVDVGQEGNVRQGYGGGVYLSLEF